MDANTETITYFRQVIDDHRQTINDLRQMINDNKETIRELKSRISEQTSQATELASETTALDLLRTTLHEVQQQNVDMHSMLTAREVQLAQAQAQRDQAKQTADDLQRTLDSQAVEFGKTIQQLRAEVAEETNAKTDLKGRFKAQMETLRDTMLVLNEERRLKADLQSRLDNLEDVGMRQLSDKLKANSDWEEALILLPSHSSAATGTPYKQVQHHFTSRNCGQGWQKWLEEYKNLVQAKTNSSHPLIAILPSGGGTDGKIATAVGMRLYSQGDVHRVDTFFFNFDIPMGYFRAFPNLLSPIPFNVTLFGSDSERVKLLEGATMGVKQFVDILTSVDRSKWPVDLHAVEWVFDLP